MSCVSIHFDIVRCCWQATWIYISFHVHVYVYISYRGSSLSSSKNRGRDETESSNKSSQIERNNTQPFVNDGKEKGRVAIVLPIIGSSVESGGDMLKENTKAEVQQEIEDRSGQRVDNAQSFGTNNQK